MNEVQHYRAWSVVIYQSINNNSYIGKISNDIVHIWDVCINDRNLQKARCHINILSDLELHQMNQFRFIEAYSIYLISHVVLRLLISRYNNIRAEEVVYQYQENGKPWFSQTLNFNLSHTYKKALIAFYMRDIGVDIEYKKELDDYDNIGKLVFSEGEEFYMNKGNKKNRFYELWTRKEAVIKGIGTGLSDDVKDLDVGIKGEFCDEHNQVWQIKKVKEDSDYTAHVAYKSNSPVSINYNIWEFR
jgi:4'-phosphopantetheinyl transferase